VKTVAISGVTSSGKTTLVKELIKYFPKSVILSLDDYYKCDFEIPKLGEYYDWDSPTSINFTAFTLEIIRQKQSKSNQLLFVEGFLLFHDVNLVKLFDIGIQLELPKEECRIRRFKRDSWIQDHPDYFDLNLWPSFEKYSQVSEQNLKSLGTSFRVLKLDALQPFNFLCNKAKQMIEENVSIKIH